MSQTMTLDELFALPNSDVRAVALEFNKNAMLESGAELLDSHPHHGELFLVKGREINRLLEKDELYFMRMTCKTGRVFVEAADTDTARSTRSITACQAFAYGVSKEEYEALLPENEA